MKINQIIGLLTLILTVSVCSCGSTESNEETVSTSEETTEQETAKSKIKSDDSYPFDNSRKSEQKLEQSRDTDEDSKWADQDDNTEEPYSEEQENKTDVKEIKYVSYGKANKAKAYARKGNVLNE